MTLFRNATVIDGTGAKTFCADVLTEGDRIARIACPTTLECESTIDCTGKILCPGFIDIHAHSELEILRDPLMRNRIGQGITTDLSGNCGVGVYPRKKDSGQLFTDILGHYGHMNWTDLRSYSANIRSNMNIALLQSHANLRLVAMKGNPNRKADDDEIRMMTDLLDEALCDGAKGFSTGLYYAPNAFCDRKELVRLLETVRKHDGLFSIHHRCEGDEILCSLEEVFDLVRQTGVRLEISHLKAIGKHNADKAEKALEMIESLRNEGFEVGFDAYPYNYGSTSLFSLLPPRLLAMEKKSLRQYLRDMSEDDKRLVISEIENPKGWDSIIKLCGFDDIRAISLDNSPSFNGLSLTQCAQKLGTDCYSTLFHLLSKEDEGAVMTDITQNEKTLMMILSHPLCSFGTDALYTGEKTHPRSSSASVRFLTRYCFEKKLLTIEDAVYRMTGLNARKLRLEDRGVIRENAFADIVVFNRNMLEDNSSPEEPLRLCSGLEYVMVNGKSVYANRTFLPALSGRVLV